MQHDQSNNVPGIGIEEGNFHFETKQGSKDGHHLINPNGLRADA